MKNQKEFLITIAIFLALIGLSISASQRPMDQGKRDITRPTRSSRLGEIKPRPRGPFLRLTKEQKIKQLERQIKMFQKRIKTARQEIRDIRRQK